jgi:hypothetical protein
MGEH